MDRAVKLIPEALEVDIEETLASLGASTSEMASVAYDTAWVARLIPHFPHDGFESTLPWLRRNQNADGSWGGAILHYHDRFVSTLSAIIALRLVGDGGADEARILAGENFLWRESGRLAHDTHDTGGYAIMALALSKEALALGLDIPSNLGYDIAQLEKKLNMLGYSPKSWLNTTLALSIEALGEYIDDQTIFIGENGHVATSPSATASAILSSQQTHLQAIEYLKDCVQGQRDGGIPFLKPFDVFEAAWTLNNLRAADAITPDHPEVRRVLDFLYETWSPERGAGAASEFQLEDLDDTAVVFSLLRWGGYPVSADVFSFYEKDRYFTCWPGETDPSLSVNIRTLAALQLAKEHPDYQRWSQKLIATLRRFDLNGYFWFDKWHISPYYLTATTIWSLHGVINDLLRPRAKWIVKTQQEDGGWGYYKHSTVEETAYALQALLFWNRYEERIDPEVIHAGAKYLLDHGGAEEFPPLWIGKTLYSPTRLVRSAIQMALFSYQRYIGN